MRYLLIFWALPMAVIWGWYFSAANNVGRGVGFFSRQFHDVVFGIYGGILGVDPSVLPGMLARACVFDTILIFGILAFRRRRQIAHYLRSMRARTEESPREIA